MGLFYKKKVKFETLSQKFSLRLPEKKVGKINYIPKDIVSNTKNENYWK